MYKNKAIIGAEKTFVNKSNVIKTEKTEKKRKVLWESSKNQLTVS